MIKLKRLSISRIEPSVGKKGELQFYRNDCYVRENFVAGVLMINHEPNIKDGWSEIEVKRYCEEHDIKLCTIYMCNGVPTYDNIIVDENVLKLINKD